MIERRWLVFGNTCILLVLVCFFAIASGRAVAAPVFVMLEYADDTISKDIDSAEIMSSIVLEKMVDKGYSFVEGQSSPEEAQLVGNSKEIPKELYMDLGYLLQTGSDITGVRLCNANEGDILDVE